MPPTLPDPTRDPNRSLLGGDGIRGEQHAQALNVGETEVIPVVREFAHIGKRMVESGRVVVHKTTVERDETVEAMLLREDLQVERVAVGRAVTEAPAPRHEGDVLIIPIMEEVLVTEKRLMLKEELRIRTVRSEQAVTETVRLREEQVTIDQTGDDTPQRGVTP